MCDQDCTALEHPIVLCSDDHSNHMHRGEWVDMSLPPPLSGQGGVRSKPVMQPETKEFTIDPPSDAIGYDIACCIARTYLATGLAHHGHSRMDA